MPELPEVEAARRFLERACLNLTIEKVTTRESGGGPRDGLFDDIVIELKGNQMTEGQIQHALQGLTLAKVCRKGKQLWLEFSSGDLVVMFHLGMTGAIVLKGHDIPLYFRSNPKDYKHWPPKFTKFLLQFSDGTLLAFRDPRRLGRIKLVTKAELDRLTSKLATDPLSPSIPTAKELQKQLEGVTAPIKAVLLDQERVFCGIGNYLADEILYQARIHPASPAAALQEGHLEALLKAMRYVIKTIDVDSDYKGFPEDWLFHSRWSKAKSKKSKITLPNGNAVVFEEIGGRTTAVVPSVQKKLTSAAAAGSKRGKRSSSMAETEETDTKTAEVKASKKRRAAEAAESLTATPKVPVEVVDDSKGATGRRRRRGD